jgi:hypoxanthine phosphoribosyltransferase
MIKKLLLSEKQICEKVAEAARWIDERYEEEEILLIAVLKGSVCFVADLIRLLSTPFQLEFVCAQSYGMRGTKPGELTLKGLEDLDLQGRHLLVIDDIYDTGQTLSHICKALKEQNPKTVTTLTLLRKILPQQGLFKPDYVCFDIEDRFVIGYGLDYKEHYRGLKEIYELLE